MKSDDHIVMHAIAKNKKLLLLLCRGSVLALAMVSQLFLEKRAVGGCVGYMWLLGRGRYSSR